MKKLILFSIFPIFAHATPTWEKSYGGYDQKDSYTKNPIAQPFVDETIGKSCATEGETLTVFAGGRSNYDYNTLYFEDLVCCGEKIECPHERDDEEL